MRRQVSNCHHMLQHAAYLRTVSRSQSEMPQPQHSTFWWNKKGKRSMLPSLNVRYGIGLLACFALPVKEWWESDLENQEIEYLATQVVERAVPGKEDLPPPSTVPSSTAVKSSLPKETDIIIHMDYENYRIKVSNAVGFIPEANIPKLFAVLMDHVEKEKVVPFTKFCKDNPFSVVGSALRLAESSLPLWTSSAIHHTFASWVRSEALRSRNHQAFVEAIFRRAGKILVVVPDYVQNNIVSLSTQVSELESKSKRLEEALHVVQTDRDRLKEDSRTHAEKVDALTTELGQIKKTLDERAQELKSAVTANVTLIAEREQAFAERNKAVLRLAECGGECGGGTKQNTGKWRRWN